jgi:crotonobetainyl-CoA:carnitine CoA-transferase CaiB-like acyl-CoA transferase
MSSGIAARGMAWAASDHPTPLPVQALDHATGYLVAAAVIRGFTRQVSTGRGTLARTSLARTAAALVAAGEQLAAESLPESLPQRDEQTFWGPGTRLAPPLSVGDAPMHWDRPAGPLGTDEPAWS